MFNGWINLVINTALFITFVVIVLYYYRPRRKEETAEVEQPKYRMLDDSDEDRC